MTGLQRAVLRLAESYDEIGPYNGPCGLCGGPDQRHRVADAMTERWLAGEDFDDLAGEFLTHRPGEHDETRVARVVAASLAWEVAARQRRMTTKDRAEALAIFWPVAS